MSFTIKCPKFSGDSAEQRSARRDYAHPVDSSIIRQMDRPAVNSFLKQAVDALADTTFGPIVASGIMINEKNYPSLNLLVNECVETLEISRPYVIISNSLPEMNALTFGSDEAPYVLLSSLLVKNMNEQQLRFVIGHECGHIAMGHVVYHSVVNLATVFASSLPVIGPLVGILGTLPLTAWSRRSEISADRAGLLCCKDLAAAQQALIQLEMPFMDAGAVDPEEYVRNSEEYLSQGTLRKLNQFDDAHPILPKRVQALRLFAESAKYYALTDCPAPANARSDLELERQTEQLIQIL